MDTEAQVLSPHPLGRKCPCLSSKGRCSQAGAHLPLLQRCAPDGRCVLQRLSQPPT